MRRTADISFAQRAGAFVLCALVMCGCYGSRPCGVELCDGADNDCDGRTDEDFADATGQYSAVDHCGACDVSCARVFPSAARTECVARDGAAPVCRIAACGDGERLAGDGAC